MQKQAINLSVLFLVSLTLFCGACRTTKKALIRNNEVKTVDTIFAIIPIDTVKSIEYNYTTPVPKELTTRDYYDNAFGELEQMLEGYKPLNFKRAVFVTENAYFKDSLDYTYFTNSINLYTKICKQIISSTSLNNYIYNDSLNLKKNFAVYRFLKDTLKFNDSTIILPYKYDFEDFLGENEWSNTFVVKLMVTGKGNCHSFPFLYKIIANELDAEAFLSLAPNHIYLKHRSKELGWYNTELTSGEFPTDAWVKASGYITIDAIRSGIYMDTLGQKESVALCLFDLARGYFTQTGNYLDGFVIQCCDLVLKHHPTNINAIILKAETLRKQFEYFNKYGHEDKAQKAFTEMQQLYVKGLEMGYREMPKEMYLAWLTSINEQKNKYINSEINRTFKTK